MIQEMKEKIAIGADIGGSHISCAAVDMHEHKIIDNTYTSIDVDNKASADEIIQKWCVAIQNTLEKAGIDEPMGIGLAMPGPFDYLKGIGLFKGVEKFENLYGVDVASKMKSSLAFSQDIPVRFMNDATSFAVGTVWSDDNLFDKSVLAITLGTGFGSAFIMDSLPVLKDQRVPEMGCVYHLPYKDGIADENFSTRGLIKAFKERTRIAVNGVKEIADKAESDESASDTFKLFGKELADFLSEWIEKASVTDIIMGGNISRAYHLFSASLESELKARGHIIDIQISKENDLMAILGSARLSDETYWNRVKPLLKDM
jgi:glucokinase